METRATQKGKAVVTETNITEKEKSESLEEVTQIENDMQCPSITMVEPMRGPYQEEERHFLKKLRKIVEQPETNSIISWSVTKDSIMIWNNREFCSTILPTYFKHKNFASFIRQLNYYGFKKMNRGGDSSEYAHEDFQGGQEHLAKPIKNKSKQGGRNNESKIDIDQSSLQAKIEKLKSYTNTMNVEIMELKQQRESIKSYVAYMKRRIENNNEYKKQQIRIFLEKAFGNRAFFNQFTQLIREKSGLGSGQTAKKRRLEDPQSSNNLVNLNLTENGDSQNEENEPVSNSVEVEGILTKAMVITDQTKEKDPLSNYVEHEGVLTEVITDKTTEKEPYSNLVEHERLLTERITDKTKEKEPVSNSVEHEGVSTEMITDKAKEREPVSIFVKHEGAPSEEQKAEEVVEWDTDLFSRNSMLWGTVMLDELNYENDARTREELSKLWRQDLIFE